MQGKKSNVFAQGDKKSVEEIKAGKKRVV